jgi:Na+/glutamate symporter
MPEVKYVFALISMVLFGCAIATYFRPWDDRASVAVPIFFVVCGLITAIIAASVERLRKRSAKSLEGDDVGDIAFPGRSTSRNNLDHDYDE